MAVIVADPAPAAVTNPVALTVATEPLVVDQVTARPINGLPFASLGVAVSCAVCPTLRLAVAGLTATDATGTLETVTLAVPLCPSLVAVIVAEPATTLVTRPVPSTVATDGLELDHVTVRPDSGLPLASFGAAVSCTVFPTCTLAEAGLTLTEATGMAQGTLTLAEPALPSGLLVAVTVNVPHGLLW